MKKETLIVGVVLVLVAALIYSFTMSDDSMEQEGVMQGDEAAMMEEGDSMEASDAMVASGDAMVADESMMKGDDSMMDKSKGAYEAYAPEKLAWAEGDGKVVLFFKASWCPSCRALDADIKASMNDIPAGLTILELDYDSSSGLKKKYGVTTQHTLVQVDASGELITKWSGGNTLASVVEKVK